MSIMFDTSLLVPFPIRSDFAIPLVPSSSPASLPPFSLSTPANVSSTPPPSLTLSSITYFPLLVWRGRGFHLGGWRRDLASPHLSLLLLKLFDYYYEGRARYSLNEVLKALLPLRLFCSARGTEYLKWWWQNPTLVIVTAKATYFVYQAFFTIFQLEFRASNIENESQLEL